MPYACKFCIAAYGLNGRDLDKLPKTFDECAQHIEVVHRYPVRRPGESQDEAEHRVFLAYRQTLWRAANALEDALGGPNAAAAAIIEAAGPVLEVNESVTLQKQADGNFILIRDPHAPG